MWEKPQTLLWSLVYTTGLEASLDGDLKADSGRPETPC